MKYLSVALVLYGLLCYILKEKDKVITGEEICVED